MLKEQNDKLKECRDELSRLFCGLEDFKRKYKEKSSRVSSDILKIEEVGKYEFKEIITVICYLVSLVEGKTYTYHEKELPFVSNPGDVSGWAYVSLESYNHHNFRNKYRLQYISSEDKEAEDELNKKIMEIHAIGQHTYDVKPLPFIKEMLTTPASNYVQIALFHKGDPFWTKEGYIYFEFNDSYFTDEPITLIDYNSKICDPNYLYIVDFVNYLTVMKLEKEDFSLTMDEMMAYARDFAEKVKKEKRGEGNVLVKK